jgi:hypothetical protein
VASRAREKGGAAVSLGDHNADLAVKVERRGTVCWLSVDGETVEITFTNDGSVDVAGAEGSEGARVRTRTRGKPGKLELTVVCPCGADVPHCHCAADPRPHRH